MGRRQDLRLGISIIPMVSKKKKVTTRTVRKRVLGSFSKKREQKDTNQTKLGILFMTKEQEPTKTVRKLNSPTSHTILFFLLLED